jgi:hypothetical protein
MAIESLELVLGLYAVVFGMFLAWGHHLRNSVTELRELLKEARNLEALDIDDARLQEVETPAFELLPVRQRHRHTLARITEASEEEA